MPHGLYAASSNSVKTTTSPSGQAPLKAPAAPIPAAPPPTTTVLTAMPSPLAARPLGAPSSVDGSGDAFPADSSRAGPAIHYRRHRRHFPMMAVHGRP